MIYPEHHNIDITNPVTREELREEYLRAAMRGDIYSPNAVGPSGGIFIEKIPESNWEYCY